MRISTPRLETHVLGIFSRPWNRGHPFKSNRWNRSLLLTYIWSGIIILTLYRLIYEYYFTMPKITQPWHTRVCCSVLCCVVLCSTSDTLSRIYLRHCSFTMCLFPLHFGWKKPTERKEEKELLRERKRNKIPSKRIRVDRYCGKSTRRQTQHNKA
jgi:hypothetical protein